jgi:CheY-like chemotaxis protein/signal transduction histidine kinase/HAMP domain-containing protein
VKTLRAKLRLILVSATVALLLIILVSLAFALIQLRTLSDIEQRLVPKLELGPKLEHEFELLRRHFQEAVAAEELSTLDEALAARNRAFTLLSKAGPALDPAEAAAIRWAIQDYYQAGRGVSERLIAGETGERLVDDMKKLQAGYERSLVVMEGLTRLRPNELSRGFALLRASTLRANALRILIALLGLIGVVTLTRWASQSLLTGLENLSRGLTRFATGDFSEPVPVLQEDELGRVAADANRMANSLQRLGDERDRQDRIKTKQAGLSEALWGELHLAMAAQRTLSFLAQVTGARAGALYLADDDGTLRLESRYALAPADSQDGAPVASVRPGEGLLGQASLADDVVVIDDLPSDHLRIRSALGDSAPLALVLVPLAQVGRPVGVIELALFRPCSDECLELLRLVRRMLVMALEAARSRERLHALLEESQTLAETLAVQEEELKRSNEELTSQQEELRVANEELGAQREELSHRNQELERTRERVQEQVDELAKVSAYKSQFLANMSHELRTPLNSMLLLSHLLSENESGNLTEKQVEHLKTVHGAGEDLLSLINDVLDLSKIEAGRQDTHYAVIELEQFTSYVRRVFEPLAAEKGLALEIETDADLPRTITTDSHRVERILTNLVGNAIKFTERGEVRLSIRRAPPDALPGEPRGVIAFAISDTGVGIPPEAQSRVFAPFEQLESHSNRRYPGTGLGLSIARESAVLLGGDLRLESTAGKGSTFTCYLPEKPAPSSASPPALRAGETQPKRATFDDRSTLSPSELYLLVIEDDPVLSEQLVSVIHARGLKALVAGSGVEGLRLARDRKPVGIVLDVRLPDIDGWAVLDELRKDPSTRSIPVHFVTAVDSPERGLGLGVVGYLTKPVTHADLAGAVRALMVSPGEFASRILIVEDDADQGKSLAELLEREDFEVCHVQTAQAALDAVRRDRFGCMILDLGLPDIDGLGLLQALRADAAAHAPRVLIHTGRSLSKQETRELEAYAEAVILKDERSTERLLDEVRLFVRHVNAPAPVLRSPSERPRTGPDVSLRGMKILLAEDDMRTVYALSALLRGKGASVLVADTGREALDTLARNPDVDGVLMDIMMPEMDGYEAMRRLRKDPRFARLPVIALTARAMKGERERCIEAGASDYLAKPVDGERLIGAVSNWFVSGRAEAGDART